MSTSDAFLRAIIDSPDDDATRLVFADWLDDHGEAERAEFIRLSCRPGSPADEARALRLLAPHFEKWAAGLTYCRFHRGFVEELYWWHPWGLVERIEEAFACHPIRDVEVNGQPDDGWGPRLAARPELARVETLRLTHSRSGWLEFPDVLAVLRSPHLTRLTALDFSGGHGYGDRRFLDLLRLRRGKQLPGLRNLRRLSLSQLGLTDRSLLALLQSPLAAQLTHLDLSGNEDRQGGGITAAGLRALVESPLWGRLEELNLGGLYLHDPEGVRLVVEALPASRITRLGLAGVFYHEVDPAALTVALASVPTWGHVRELNLSWTHMRPEDVRRLVGCPGLGEVTRLDFAGSDLDDEGVAILADCPLLGGLTSLKIGAFGNPITDAALEALARSPHVTALTSLSADDRGMGNDGVAVLSGSPNARRLRHLTLPSSVTDEGLKALAASPHWRSLTVLEFGSIYRGDEAMPLVTEEGARAVVGTENLPHLAVFDRRSELLSPEARRVLSESDRIACLGFGGREGGKLSTLDLYDFGGYPFFAWAKDAN